MVISVIIGNVLRHHFVSFIIIVISIIIIIINILSSLFPLLHSHQM